MGTNLFPHMCRKGLQKCPFSARRKLKEYAHEHCLQCSCEARTFDTDIAREYAHMVCHRYEHARSS